MLSTVKLAISLVVLSVPGLSIAAQTGGTYLPPQGSDFSKIATGVQVACNADNSFSKITLVGQLIFTSAAFDDTPTVDSVGNTGAGNRWLDVLGGKLTEKDSDQRLKIQVVGENQIAIRNKIDGAWLTVGEISPTDLANACLTQYKSAQVPVTLLPGVQVSFTRSMGMSFCLSLPDNYTRSRVMTYSIFVSTPDGSSQKFDTEEEIAFPDKPSCQHWEELPWVSK